MANRGAIKEGQEVYAVLCDDDLIRSDSEGSFGIYDDAVAASHDRDAMVQAQTDCACGRREHIVGRFFLTRLADMESPQ